tara:strand:- start:2503 stop:2808 length:306 start_codon:yes stop_codon:yes gene_type:complete
MSDILYIKAQPYHGRINTYIFQSVKSTISNDDLKPQEVGRGLEFYLVANYDQCEDEVREIVADLFEQPTNKCNIIYPNAQPTKYRPPIYFSQEGQNASCNR